MESGLHACFRLDLNLQPPATVIKRITFLFSQCLGSFQVFRFEGRLACNCVFGSTHLITSPFRSEAGINHFFPPITSPAISCLTSFRHSSLSKIPRMLPNCCHGSNRARRRDAPTSRRYRGSLYGQPSFFVLFLPG